MDDLAPLTFFGGMAMGVASSLHCAGMCGGIGASLMLAFRPQKGPDRRHRALFVAEVGRILAYGIEGAVVGALGGGLYQRVNEAALVSVLPFVGATALGWIGLSLLGLVPPLRLADRVLAPLSARCRLRAGRVPLVGPLLAGIAWGLMPCGIVLGALFYAMLSGSSRGGLLVMTGFGLGTLPSVTATALGLGRLETFARVPRLRKAAGLSILGIALLSAALPVAEPNLFCLTRTEPAK